MKTYKSKYKKAANGLQSVAVPQQGSINNVMSSATSMAAAGAQLGPWGAVAGGALGLATGMYQKDAEDKANMLAVNKNKYLSANRAVDGVDDSVDQKTQVFKGGGNVVVNGKPKYRRADGKVVKRGLWSNTYLSKKEDGAKKIEVDDKVNTIEGDAISKVLMNRNKNKNFIDRAINPSQSPSTFMDSQGSSKLPMTLRMATGEDDKGDTQMFPTLVQNGNSVTNSTPKSGYYNESIKLPGRDPKMHEYISSVGYKKASQDLGNHKDYGYGKGTKMIEIEGKGTPEIHTDKNFNVKNLGTTPHTKGGNKVEASEGDVVFNTQNSLAKYNKIASAIKSGDKATLTKEKNRLPADGGTKNVDGNSGVKPPRQVTPVMFRGKPLPYDDKNRNGQYNEYSQAVNGLSNGSSKLIGANEKGSRGLSYPYATVENSKGTQYRHDDVPTIAPKTATVDTKAAMTPSTVQPLSAAAMGNTTTSDVPTTNVPASKVGNNIAQFAGVANNLYQGLKPEVPISQQYFDPQLNKYTDRSESLRQQSVSAMNVQNSNARNVSGGNAGNMRANQNQSALSNYGRQDAINEQEMGRRDAIETSNTGLKNAAGQYNLQRRDMYQEQIDGTRAAKTAYMDQAAQDVGRLGNARQEEQYLRDKDAKQNAVQLAGLNRIKTTDFATDENGKQVTRLGTTPATAPTSLFPTPSTTPAFNPQTLFTGKQTPTQKAAAAAELTPKPVKAPKYTKRRI